MKNKTSFFFLLCGFVMILSHGVMAACSSPSGSASQTRYDFGANKYYFCDNTDWVEIGGGGGGDGGSGSCGLPWGGTIADGANVTAYQQALPSGVACVSETRICSSGALSGSYLNPSCNNGCAGGTMVSWSNCSAIRINATHGQNRNVSDPSPGYCQSGWYGSRSFSCSNGSWSATNSGTCSYQSIERDCGSCFAAGSTVLMADGTHKAIEDIKIGEYLMGSDGKPTRVVEYDRPIMEYRDGDPQRLISINDKGYLMTNNHPVLTTDGWKALWVDGAESEAYDLLKGKVSQLDIGDEIIMAGDKTMIVETINVLQHTEDTRLYNFVLDGDPVFYVDGMAVMSFVPDKAGKYTAHLEHEGEPK